jgi:hypothetical protein
MAKKIRHNVMIDVDLLEGMMAMKSRTGVSYSEQVRRGVRMWLESRTWPARKTGRRGSPERSLPPFIGLPTDH